MIDLRPDHLEIVRDLLRQHVPECEVRAFGSRFKWTAKQASDLDLAVVGTKRLPTKKIMRLKEAFEESILPMRVDVLDWHAITPEFQRVIDAGFEVIQGGEVSPLAPASSPSAAGSSATPLFTGSYQIKSSTLADICVLIVDCPHSTPVWTESGEIVLRSQNIRGGRLDLSEKSYTDQDHFKDRIRRAVPQPDDLVITREAPMGEVCKIPSGLECCLGQRMVLLRPDKQKVSPGYLLYALQSAEVQHQIMWSEGTGSTVSNLRIPHLEALKIPLPNLEIQKEIASILSTLEDRIELCRRTNETLESTARALFKDWFIDFGPVRAKMEGRDPYLSADVWSLFPDRLIDSDLGEIPDSWTCATLKELTVKIGSGSTPRGGSEVYIDSGISLIRSQNVYDSNFVWDGLAYITDSAADQLKNVTLELEDVLINITGASILRTCVVEPATLPARVNQHVAIIRAKPEIPSRYLHLHLLQKSTKDYLMGMNAGASREAVTKAHLESTPVILPSDKVLSEFKKSTAPLFNQIQQSNDSIRMLSSLRDNLLPKLLSGELMISELHINENQTKSLSNRK